MFGTTTFLLLGIVVLIFFALKKYFSRNDTFWTDQGVETIDVGKIASFYKRITFQISFLELTTKIYNAVGDNKFAGFVDMGSPIFLVKDLDLLKLILVKDFDHFVDRRIFDMNKSDKTLSRMMTNLNGKEWKDLRSVMSPTFTTGRIRRMFEFFNSCGRDLAKYVQNVSKKDEVIDFQDTFGRYTMAAISSIAFGLQADTFTNENSHFRKMAIRFSNISFTKMVKFMAYFLIPKVAKMLRLAILDTVAMDFFSGVVEENMKERRKEGQGNRQDFLQMMLEAQAGQLKVDEKELDGYEKDALMTETVSKKEYAVVLDDATIVAQSVLFFVAGADTIETLLTFAAYELALNPEIQERLAEEVTQSLDESEGNLTYDATHQLKYLDMVISETLRLYPPAPLTERKCTQDYKIPDTDVVIKKGTVVQILIAGIQQDEKYYPNPSKFNPEHFNSENKGKRHPYSYLPFGQGPRNCIAMRFALTEAKAALAHLVYNFKIEPSEKTPIPMKYSKKAPMKPENGMWLKFKVREGTQNGFVKL